MEYYKNEAQLKMFNLKFIYFSYYFNFFPLNDFRTGRKEIVRLISKQVDLRSLSEYKRMRTKAILL